MKAVRSFLLLNLFVVACATTAPPASSASNPLDGAWEFVSGRYTEPDGKVTDASSPELRSQKVLNDGRFVYITFRRDGTFVRSAGGRYSIQGGTYSEKIDASSAEVMHGKTYSFEWRLVGDLWYHSGMKDGVRLEEVWRRVSP